MEEGGCPACGRAATESKATGVFGFWMFLGLVAGVIGLLAFGGGALLWSLLGPGVVIGIAAFVDGGRAVLAVFAGFAVVGLVVVPCMSAM